MKILLLGNSEARKNLLQKYLGGNKEVLYSSTKKTVGVDFYHHKISNLEKIDPKLKKFNDLTAQLWDCSEKEEFREIMPYYLSGTQGGVILFNVCEKTSFQKAIELVNNFK
ncbi:MAG: hypothetical protein ACW967_11505, partial [Candidatus Hodarchaeales archaeon]